MPLLLAAALTGLVAVGLSGAGSAPPQAQTPSTAPDREQVGAFAGEYQAGTFVMTVTLQRDGTLTLLFPGQPLYRLDHESGTRYRIRELRPGFGVEFMRDAERRITGVTVRQPPPQQDFVAPRKGGPQPASAATAATNVPARPPVRPAIPPAGSSSNGPSPAATTEPAVAAAAVVEASAAVPAGFQRVTFVEGATLDLPGHWKVWVDADHRSGETRAFRARLGDPESPDDALELDATRPLRDYFRADPGASLHAYARTNWRSLRVSDFDVPGAKAIELRNPRDYEDGVALYAIDLGGMQWLFRCQTSSGDALRKCATAVRTVRMSPGATRPAASPAATTPVASAGPAAPTATTVRPAKERPSSVIDNTTAPLVAEWSKDPRLASLKAEDREYALEEAAGHVIHCTGNVALGNFYDCPCLGSRMLDARLAVGFERVPAPGARAQPGATVLKVDAAKLAHDVYTTKWGRDVTRCIAPDKIERYGIARANELFASSPEATRTRAADCVGKALPEAFRATPGPSIEHIQQLFTTAAISCRRAAR